MTTTFEPAPSPSRSREANGHRPLRPARPPQSPRGDNLMMFAVIFSCLALIAGMFGVGLGRRAIDEAGSGGAGAGAGAPSTATIHLTEFALDPSSVTIASGGTLAVHNDGSVPHDLAIEGTDFRTPLISAGETFNLKLDGLAPGTYNLLCQVAGHAPAGMRGSLVVTEGGGTAAVTGEAGHSHAAGGTGAMTSDQMDAAMETSIKAFPAKTQGLGGQDLAPRVLADGTKVFDLTASVVKWEVEPGKFVDAWTYNGTVPGPTITVNSGDMHMHGMAQLVIAKDGFPLAQPYEADTINVAPGERYTVLIHATEVGTWVWHCHILTHAESMEKGMFGMVTALVVT